MTCQTYSLFVLSVIMICFGRFGNSSLLAQLENDIDQLKADFSLPQCVAHSCWLNSISVSLSVAHYPYVSPLLIVGYWAVLQFDKLYFYGKNSSNSDVADGGPIFTDKLANWTERNEKRIILSQIVSLYLEMLENTDKPKAHIRHISEELHTLKNSLPDGLKKMKDLMYLSKLQMTDLKIQRKAAHELFSVLQKLVETPTSLKKKRSQFLRKCKC